MNKKHKILNLAKKVSDLDDKVLDAFEKIVDTCYITQSLKKAGFSNKIELLETTETSN